ncbi:MAG: chemotaxis protein CheW [Mycobacteriales bacterium]
MSSGLVTFALGEREYATPLSSVREVVRLEGLADLPGMTPPLAGVLDLRGTALPVLDLRLGDRDARGDVLVLEGADGQLLGVAVDRVRAVVEEGELGVGGAAGDELPDYVVEVLRGTAGPVFLVDLTRMVDSARRAVR